MGDYTIKILCTRSYALGSDPGARVGALLARHFAAWFEKLDVAVEYLGLWDTVDATPGLAVSETCPAAMRRHAAPSP